MMNVKTVGKTLMKRCVVIFLLMKEQDVYDYVQTKWHLRSAKIKLYVMIMCYRMGSKVNRSLVPAPSHRGGRVWCHM